MKKILIYSGIAIVVIAILVVALRSKPKAKKDCGCNKAQDPVAAINAMTEHELKEQILILDPKAVIDNLNVDQLKAKLKELVNVK